LDISALIISVVGALLTVALVYYGFKTLKLFKTNVAARAWTYISLRALFGIGLVILIIDAVDPMELLPAGGILQTIGGVFLVVGLRKNYLFWVSKDRFAYRLIQISS